MTSDFNGRHGKRAHICLENFTETAMSSRDKLYIFTSVIVLVSFLFSKSMAQKSNHNFEKKYPYLCAGTLLPMHIKDILTKY